MRFFEQRESAVRSYCRKWQAMFDRAAAPGDHNGTFRGIDRALVTGTAALRTY